MWHRLFCLFGHHERQPWVLGWDPPWMELQKCRHCGRKMI